MLTAWPAWDTDLFLRINGISSGFLTSLMRAVSDVDNWAPFLLAAVACLLWMGRTRPQWFPSQRRWRVFGSRNPRIVLLCLVVSTGLSDQVCYHIKHSTGRSRPFLDPEIGHLVEYRGDVHGNRSFPSAHSANSAALAVTAALAYPPLAVPAILVTLTVGFSRIYLGVHYPVDVLVGWGIGAGCAMLFWLLFRKMATRQGLIGFTNRFRTRQPHLRDPLPEGWVTSDMISADGYRTEALLFRGNEDLVIMVHGLHGDVRLMTGPGRQFTDTGASVLVVPLRGHDGHPVPVTSGGPSEVYDVLGAVRFADSLGFARERTVIYGSSMGGSTAMKAAGLLGTPVAGVIAHGSYDDFFKASRMKLGAVRTFFLRMLIPPGARRGLDLFRPLEYANATPDGSVFVFVHGDSDSVSPVSTGISMSEALPVASVIGLDGAAHPVWSGREWNRTQMRGVVSKAMECITLGLSQRISVDGSGSIRNLRANPGTDPDGGEG